MILGAASWMQAQSFAVLHEFNLKDGQVPNGALVQDADRNLYGTTVWGGAYATGGENVGWGTVFKLSPSGTETVLHSFSDNRMAPIPMLVCWRDQTVSMACHRSRATSHALIRLSPVVAARYSKLIKPD